MIRILKYISLFLTILLFSCSSESEIIEPSSQAKFTVEISNSSIAPATVKFINQSVNASSYLWKFGNGDSLFTTSNQTIEYTYTTAGNYVTSLTITPNNSDLYYNKLYQEKTISITNQPYKRLYFTDRNSSKVMYVILDGNYPPALNEFESATLNKPYGMHIDTTSGKVYVTDYAEQVLNRYNWNGLGQEVLMNSSTNNFDSPLGIIVINSKLYWCDRNGIYTANMDGSSTQVFVSMPGEYPQDITYDHINEQFYFTNNMDTESGGIWRVNLNGANLTEIIPDVWGAGIEIYPEQNKLYFYSALEGMYICDLDGSNSTLFDGSNADKWVWGIAINKDSGKIYYPNRVDLTIMMANTDGSNPQVFIPASANINPNAITIDTYR